MKEGSSPKVVRSAIRTTVSIQRREKRESSIRVGPWVALSRHHSICKTNAPTQRQPEARRRISLLLSAHSQSVRVRGYLHLHELKSTYPLFPLFFPFPPSALVSLSAHRLDLLPDFPPLPISTPRLYNLLSGFPSFSWGFQQLVGSVAVLPSPPNLTDQTPFACQLPHRYWLLRRTRHCGLRPPTPSVYWPPPLSPLLNPHHQNSLPFK
ncbi:hypothetical protein BO79DRAFT_45893 [Aspergillus costaricaensis CBS 115574]|uniref:Uncharacterized protein n=1 Tax=Aspergillus costaricaensis CBS 115574 TaxID=1448317 RepID=A0ACD1I5U7_9EURO|nr:hypothetical protein BO79DRAFT_45893 [Aspergillus costaricaensis CBS 115574]RAK85683.1 hypothetical protein BO79DRAFT_45893 [Aspergillus costaricaensis CBS 115574]